MLGCQGTEQPDQPLVASTIKPVHALVYAVAGGQDAPLALRQLLPDGASPHHYALKPSDRQALGRARVVFRIGSSLEGFLDKPLASLPVNVLVVDLIAADGIRHLPNRTPHGHAEDVGSSHAQHDPHVWLSPPNAIAMAHAIARALGQVDPPNREAYARNAAALAARIQAADARIREQLQPVQHRPYLSFHDAWQHFDAHYGLAFAGAVSLDGERQPGARHVQSLRQLLLQQQAVCLFQEPQFHSGLANALLEGTTVRLGELDSLGMHLPLDGDTYIRLLEQAAAAFVACLAAGDSTQAEVK